MRPSRRRAERFEKLGVTVVNGSPEQLAQRQAGDSQRSAAVIRDAGIKLD